MMCRTMNCRFLLKKTRLRILLKLIAVITLPIIVYFAYVYATEQLYFQRHYLEFVRIHHPPGERVRNGCVLPQIDPWDERAKVYYAEVPPIKCEQIQPFLTELTSSGMLQWNQTEIDSKKISVSKLKCVYQEFDRLRGNDDGLTLSDVKSFTIATQIGEQFVNVSCRRNGYQYYYNIHAWVPPKLLMQQKTGAESVSKHPNILIFVLDGMSQANFIRQLPLTYRVLTTELSSIVLKGLIKVGVNTYPNMIAMLTGQNVHGSTLPEKVKDGYFDNWPLCWKNFSVAGFVTMLTEDRPDITGFNYMEKGFIEKPTNVYSRPYWVAVEDYYGPLYGQSSDLCFANVAKHQIFLQDVKRSLDSFGSRPFFSLVTHTDISHHRINLAQVMDNDLVDFYRWFRKTHANNTILIAMGDHGINFGKFRQTQLGRIEASMPFFALSIPEYLHKLHPNLVRNFRLNRNRMASWYDVYDTLMDVLMLRFDQPRQSWSEHGHSLWYPLPQDRTCGDAGIPPEYCPCEEEIILNYSSNSSSDLVQAVKDILSYVNNLIRTEPQCVQLTLGSVRSVVKKLPNPSLAVPTGFQNVYRIVVQTLPNNALLEATMVADAWSSTFIPTGTIYRINEYGNSSWCVDDRTLKLYCACYK